MFIYWAEIYNSVHDAETPSTSSYTHNAWITLSVNSFKNVEPRKNKCVRWKGSTRIRIGTASKKDNIKALQRKP